MLAARRRRPAHQSPPPPPYATAAYATAAYAIPALTQFRAPADGGTIGLEVSFAAFLAVILGLFIPVVFLVTLYIQSEAQGTATSFRNPDSSGGQRFDACPVSRASV